jgi:hypothetical protein
VLIAAMLILGISSVDRHISTLVFPGIISFRDFRISAGLTQPEKFKSRRQSHLQPAQGFEFAK